MERCVKHSTEAAHVYCVTCDQLLCVDCTLTNHKGHEQASLKAKKLQYRQQVQQSLPDLKIGLSTLNRYGAIHKKERESGYVERQKALRELAKMKEKALSDLQRTLEAEIKAAQKYFKEEKALIEKDYRERESLLERQFRQRQSHADRKLTTISRQSLDLTAALESGNNLQPNASFARHATVAGKIQHAANTPRGGKRDSLLEEFPQEYQMEPLQTSELQVQWGGILPSEDRGRHLGDILVPKEYLQHCRDYAANRHKTVPGIVKPLDSKKAYNADKLAGVPQEAAEAFQRLSGAEGRSLSYTFKRHGSWVVRLSRGELRSSSGTTTKTEGKDVSHVSVAITEDGSVKHGTWYLPASHKLGAAISAAMGWSPAVIRESMRYCVGKILNTEQTVLDWRDSSDFKAVDVSRTTD